MGTFRHFSSIKKRILFVTLSFVLGMCVLIGSVSYYIFQTYLQHSLISATETNLQLLSDTMNTSINDVYRMVRFLQSGSAVSSYIQKGSSTDTLTAIAAYDRISEEYINNPANTYMPRVAVVTENDFLQIVATSYSSTANLAEEVPKLPFFTKLLEDNNYNFSTGFIADPFYRKERIVLPIVRPLLLPFKYAQTSYIYMEVSAELFSSPLQHYNISPDSNVYLTLSGHHYIYENGEFRELIEPYELLESDNSSVLMEGTQVAKIRIGSNEKTIVSAPLDMHDCFISQSISNSELFQQQRLFILLIAGTLIGIIAIGTALMFLMNRMINRPISKLQEKMLHIAQGDFSRESSIEWNHELGDIGRGINDLSENVCRLMERRLEDEKQKRDLEYKMLQSQVNPHFIYNTLNSIKWMATIQGAEGISEMTTALSRLLKSISKGTSLLISVREELSLIENYFTIQNYRYGGTISLSITVDDEKIYEESIIKFTLQPLVENAIFHGIEPKGGLGHIEIHLYYEPDFNPSSRNLRIDITDDGVGIKEEKALQILQDNGEDTSDFFREIGISNVHKRIQYEFGAAYGITIHSVEGEYATMSILIPAKEGVDEDV